MKKPEVNWTHPLVGANPLMMGTTWQAAAVKTLMEAHQKKVIRFMFTGVWR